MIYLDNNATTRVDDEVVSSMTPYFRDIYGNPSSIHTLGLKAKTSVEAAREEVASVICSSAGEIMFTSGATESNNTVLKGIFFRGFLDGEKNQHFIISSIEHKCILETVKFIEKMGAEVTILPVNNQGLVDIEDVRAAITSNTVLVSIMLANNEIGSINPIREIAAICNKNDVLFHTDAAQAFGKIHIDVGELGVDFLSSSAHKHYGPKGVGILFVKSGLRDKLVPLMHGGNQEMNLRSGTINTPSIVGMAKSVSLFCSTSYVNAEMVKQGKLRDYLYAEIKKNIPSVILNGPPLDKKHLRLANNLNISFPGINKSVFNRKTSKIMFSTGSACSSADLTASYVLKNIGLEDDLAQVSYRFGLSKYTTKQDIDEAVLIIKNAHRLAS
ncbi:cysteine desulfurase [Candidatus Saccharibacteria bacterium]|nr:cysteine desulfurase [Candidatus Saccharibacteria bacterium]